MSYFKKVEITDSDGDDVGVLGTSLSTIDINTHLLKEVLVELKIISKQLSLMTETDITNEEYE